MPAAFWVCVHDKRNLKELVFGAYTLSGQVSPTVLAFDPDMAEAAKLLGAQAILIEEGSRATTEYLESVVALVEAEEPQGVLFDLGADSRALAFRLAARLHTAALADVKRIDDHLVAEQLVYGGAAIRTSKYNGAICIALIGPGAFEAEDIPSEGDIATGFFVEPRWNIELLEERVKPAESVDIAAAKRIVAAGLGVQSTEGISMVEELASLLGAETACTRPIAEGLSWMPTQRYIGISGNFVHPDLYLALGISGQIQHSIGIDDSKIIVSINKDKDCAMMNTYADYAIVADLDSFVPALIENVKTSIEGDKNGDC